MDVVDRSVNASLEFRPGTRDMTNEKVFVCSTGKRKEERNVVVRLTEV